MNSVIESKPIEILLVEDNEGDVRLLEEVLKESKVFNKLNIVHDGLQALAYVRGEDSYAHTRRPDLILLDLNLPKIDGRQVLEEIKRSSHLRRIPVVILTTSRAEEDILKCYDLHANCYIVKPFDLESFIAIVKTLEDFWLSIVKLPA